MTDQKAQLLAILQIAHETSMRRSGISMRDALVRAHYKELRPQFSSRDLIALIEEIPALADVWLLYSEDERTSGGWYLLPSGEIGQVTAKESRQRFNSLAEAVAEYVVRELDFWASMKR